MFEFVYYDVIWYATGILLNLIVIYKCFEWECIHDIRWLFLCWKKAFGMLSSCYLDYSWTRPLSPNAVTLELFFSRVSTDSGVKPAKNDNCFSNNLQDFAEFRVEPAFVLGIHQESWGTNAEESDRLGLSGNGRRIEMIRSKWPVLRFLNLAFLTMHSTSKRHLSFSGLLDQYIMCNSFFRLSFSGMRLSLCAEMSTLRTASLDIICDYLRMDQYFCLGFEYLFVLFMIRFSSSV